MTHIRPAAAALALLCAGCFAGSDAAMTMSWSLTKNGDASTCEATGAAAFALVADRRGRDLHYEETVPCGELGVTFEGFRPGVYDVSVQLVDAQGHALNEPFALEVELFSGDWVDLGNFEFAFDTGRFAASWLITRNGEPATCADVGATTFQLTTTGGGQNYVHTFDCAETSGTTGEVPAGSWIVGVALLDAAGNMLNAAAYDEEVTLGAEETRALGEFEFSFSYRDAFFRVHMGTAEVLGGNCQSTFPDGGAGVVQQEIRVTRPGSAQCVAYTVAGIFDASGEQKTTPTCEAYSCQNEHIQQHLADLQNGDYVIQVVGYKPGRAGTLNACYRSSGIPFTMNGADIDLGTLVALPDDSANPGRCN